MGAHVWSTAPGLLRLHSGALWSTCIHCSCLLRLTSVAQILAAAPASRLPAPRLPPPPVQAWARVFDQACFSLCLFQLVMVGILGEL